MHEHAGRQARSEDLIDLDALTRAYFEIHPDPANVAHRVAFGTSGHRGSSLDAAFNEDHILAVTQAIAEYRAGPGITGPLFVGRDTHGLSEPAWRTTLEVLVANGVETVIDSRDGFTPTPAVSHAILEHNRIAPGSADGVLLTPSHNPPRDGGIKYNPPSGGPAGGEATSVIAARANQLLEGGLKDVKRIPFERALAAARRHDFLAQYVDDLPSDPGPGRDPLAAGVKIGADPLGGAAVAYWGEIADRHRLDLTVVNDRRRSALGLHAARHRRQDPHGLLVAGGHGQPDQRHARRRFDVATGNDADADRHGIVTPDGGLMNPNHYLAAHRLSVRQPAAWGADVAVGKTLVSSSMIDRVVASSAAACWRCRSASSTSCPACWMARSASAARNRPGPRSCARTARCGPPTRTACCWACWPPRSRAVTGGARASFMPA
jgi:phosphoglucomutase